MSQVKCPFHHKVMEPRHVKSRGVTQFTCPVLGCSVIIETLDSGEYKDDSGRGEEE